MSMSGDVAYADLPPEEARAVAASELRGGLAWTVFGIAVLVALVADGPARGAAHQPVHGAGPAAGAARHRHDRARRPAGLRSWRRGGRLVRGPQFAMSGESARRLALVVGLIVAYTVVLLGRGLPFWLGATIYVDGVDPAPAGAAARRRRPRR